ncbi:hypothetical protein R6Q59_036132 [Mikania micrantha]
MSSMKKLRWIDVNFIKDVKGDGRPTIFSDSFHPIELCFLKLEFGKQKELWKGCKHLPHLKVLHLESMDLQSTPDFHGLPQLQKLTLNSCYYLEEIHPSIGSHTSLEYLKIFNCRKLRMFPTVVHMRNLKTLKIRLCDLKNGEIPSGIGELSKLKELDLGSNDFSHLDFSISQLTCLKVLNLSRCDNLIELPDLPSSLVFLNAKHWIPLTTNIVNGGERLLQSMLEGDAIKNGSMILLPPGFKIPMGFTPPLLKVRRYTLQLPENWQDYFSGFLICVVLDYVMFLGDHFKIIVKQALSGVSFEDDLVWEESDGKWYTLVWYVSFDLLRDTARWNQTYKALSFEITEGKCSGFGARLVAKKNRSGLMETSTTNSYDYTPLFKIEYDKASDAIMMSSLYNYI